MKLFAQIRKVDEAQRLVYGRAAEEVVDRSGEIMDYASSKPHFAKWSEDCAKDTDGKSLGNLRSMHTKIAAGKLTGIDFNDAEKAIDICAKVVDDAEWKKVLEGVYTGFSMGGSYVGPKKVEKVDGQDVTRYTAAPNEISLVDRPCIPTAKFFEVQKADGTLAKVDFKEPAPAAETDGGSIQGTPEQVDQLVKLMTAQGINLGDVLAKLAPVAAPAEPAAHEPVQKLDAGALRKNFYNCGELAYLLASLVNLRSSAAWSSYYEGDESPIPKRIGAVIALAGEVLQDMIAEELKELGEGASLELSDKAGTLAKFQVGGNDADPLLELIKYGARNSGSDKDRIAKIHALTLELGHACEPADKSAPAGDLAKSEPGAVEKAVEAAFAKIRGEEIEPLQKALTEAQATIQKLSEQPAPSRVVLRTVAKSEDLGSDSLNKADDKPQPIVDAHGEKHEAAGLIKFLHNSGGQPLVRPLSK